MANSALYKEKGENCFLNSLRNLNPLSFGDKNAWGNGMPCKKANPAANWHLGNEKLITVVIVVTNTVPLKRIFVVLAVLEMKMSLVHQSTECSDCLPGVSPLPWASGYMWPIIPQALA